MDDNARRRLRRGGIAARRALVGEPRRSAEAALHAHLSSLTIAPHHVVGVTIADDGEPDLGPLVARLRRTGRGVALPVLLDDPDDFSMRFRHWRDDDVLQPGRYGIPCPPAGPERVVVPETVLVPLVRFDGDGNRLGRGAGFYDRWLDAHRPFTIGVAFEAQRAASLEPQPHDVPLDVVVTELGIRWLRPMESS